MNVSEKCECDVGSLEYDFSVFKNIPASKLDENARNN